MQTEATSRMNPALDLDAPAQSKVDILRAYKEGPSETNRNAVIEAYYPFVRYHAERLAGKLPPNANTDADDLAQEGCFGLLDALESLDLDRGVKFETFSLPRVTGSMLDSLRKNDWVPRLVRQHEKQVKGAIASLSARLGHEPSDQECAEYLEITIDTYREWKADAQVARVASIDKTLSSRNSTGSSANRFDKDQTFGASLANTRIKSPLRQIMDAEMSAEVLKGFNEVERDIFHYYVVEEKPMAEIGTLLDLSESRVSQMFTSIVGRIQGRVLEGLQRSDTSFMSIVAQQIVGTLPDSETKFLPLADEVVRLLDEANAVNSVHFEFLTGPSEFNSTGGESHFVDDMVAVAKARRGADDASVEEDTTSNSSEVTESSFGFDFT